MEVLQRFAVRDEPRFPLRVQFASEFLALVFFRRGALDVGVFQSGVEALRRGRPTANASPTTARANAEALSPLHIRFLSLLLFFFRTQAVASV